MGEDFICGCRRSGGHWFPCKRHENDLEILIERLLYIKKVNVVKICSGYFIKASLEDIPIEELRNLDYEED